MGFRWSELASAEIQSSFFQRPSSQSDTGIPDFTTTTNNNPQSSLSNPRGIAFDDNGSVYVASDGSSRVMMFAPPFTSGMVATIVIGQPSFTAVGASTTASGLADPVGVHLIE